MIPTGFGEISVIHSGAGIDGQAIWSMGFDNNAADSATDVATNVSAALASLGYLDILSTSVTVDEVRVKLGPDSTGESASDFPSLSGTVGGQAAPPNLALLVRKNTALGGRRGRGRCYIPGLPEFALDQNGLVVSSIITIAQDFFTDWGGAMVLASKPLHLLHGDATSPTAISSLVVDGKLATQRRRLRR
jgi:hypothetical protein